METKFGMPQAVLLGAIVIAAAILLTRGTISQTKDDSVSFPAPTGEVIPVSAKDHLFGDPKAPVVVIEYSDLECPFCKGFQETMHDLVESSGGKVAWVYRHFPLDNIHPKARREANAAECAAELGGNTAFWKYIDGIFAITPSNNQLPDGKLADVANAVGLDAAKFKACLESAKYKDLVEAEFQDGIKAGVTATPSSIVMNVKTGKKTMVVGAQSLESLRGAVESVNK
ncbi:DsbA family protein [Candidatus Parcubacteria bacterium]|nr:DsbA family protein [Candidatus Parcubacteria bacterium]